MKETKIDKDTNKEGDTNQEEGHFFLLISPKLKCPQNWNGTKTEVSPKLKGH